MRLIIQPNISGISTWMTNYIGNKIILNYNIEE